jgi:MFS family permease
MSMQTIAADRPAAIDGRPAGQRSRAAAAIFTALAMASLDTAIANIALPAIAADLHVGPADVIWVVNVYQIALVATLLPLAALGEIVGHHRIYLGGLLLFTLASLICACAWSSESSRRSSSFRRSRHKAASSWYFRRFLGVFARPEHPPALFLDDLQWLDAATLDKAVEMKVNFYAAHRKRWA